MVPADEAFIRAQTSLGEVAFVPGVRLHLAGALTPLWLASETFLNAHGVAPPFWAFAWPGAQALARHVRLNPDLVRGRRVLDFAAGCGLAAIVCAQAGAEVEAADIDPLACAAIRLNAAANGSAVRVVEGDVVDVACRWDLVLAGDVFYEAPMTRRILPWLRACASVADVIVADPGRAYAPADGVAEIARYTVPTSLELEDREARVVRLLRLAP